jgi:hypothetical protein
MGIGIGGGFGPFRAGVGVGGSGMASCLVYFLFITIFAILGFWPYILWDWTLEAAYVVLILGGLVIYMRRKAKTRAEEVRLCFQAQLDVSRKLLQLLEVQPYGRLEPTLTTSERLLTSFAGVALVEPRSVSRGGPRVPRSVDSGDVWITSRGIRYHGTAKSVEWRFDRIVKKSPTSDLVTFTVTNRKTISGLQPRSGVLAPLLRAVEWGEAVAGGDALEGVQLLIEADIEEAIRSAGVESSAG